MLLTEAEESVLDRIPSRCVGPLANWIMENLLAEQVMKVDQWLELSFHLCKQRWDATMEWLESQPISKVLLMSRIQSKFVEEQNREMKKAGRRKS